MQMKWMAPSRDTLTAAPNVWVRKARNVAWRHCELSVPALGIGMTADADVVGWVEEGRINLGALANHLLQKSDVATVPAADAVVAYDPDVARLSPPISRQRRDHVIVRVLVAAEQHIELIGGETRHRKDPDRRRTRTARALFWASFRPTSSIVGTSAIPIDLAASRRPCPAMSTPSGSRRIGFVNPNSLIEAMICSTCRFECARALRGSGGRLVVGL
jgi:hypothetical protein